MKNYTDPAASTEVEYIEEDGEASEGGEQVARTKQPGKCKACPGCKRGKECVANSKVCSFF